MNKETLDFLVFLNNNKLVDLRCIHYDSDIGFYNRKKLQKLVFLAQSRFNLPSNYAYDIYKHGPYSPRFSADYYQMNLDIVNQKTYSLPSSFDENRYTALFIDKDINWLEVSTTAIDLFDKNKDIHIKDLVNSICNLKPQFSIPYITKVVNDLLREKLITSIREELESIRKKIPDLLKALAKEDPALIK
ncbi:hypothetical protein [Candidatus Nitrosocosmicus franklandus]|uniref:Antitoxin SocA-like Panacea domain-containing protein n=1 Tax=Candidatus Nitrosocosmicus franklandianus TaxID=1798806 RepID=A0A484IGG9_9ARCH|nr:hypothetical protein [Candidatus Nitrosocosmicus franklandus]VFJ14046.1 conserved protein of unknown function [Candidatus Nitrosocosmicus franklandus]